MAALVFANQASQIQYVFDPIFDFGNVPTPTSTLLGVNGLEIDKNVQVVPQLLLPHVVARTMAAV